MKQWVKVLLGLTVIAMAITVAAVAVPQKNAPAAASLPEEEPLFIG